MALSEKQIASYVHKMFPDLRSGSRQALIDLMLAIGGAHTVAVDVDFGASFTDEASAVVTGLPWMEAESAIAVTPSADGVDPDEVRLLDFRPVISDRVAGTGFTLTVYSEPEAKGTYSFLCVGS